MEEHTEEQESSDGSDIPTIECRICHQRVDENQIKSEEVINPCNCQGMYAFAHKTCINQRLEMNGHKSCDICRFSFIMKKQKKSFWDWVYTVPHKEECVELIVRSMNVINIFVIIWLTFRYLGQCDRKCTILLVWPTHLLTFVRSLILSKLWFNLFIKWFQSYNIWKTKNYRVFVEQNPNYKFKTGLHRSRSPPRVSGSFSPKKGSPENTKKISPDIKTDNVDNIDKHN